MFDDPMDYWRLCDDLSIIQAALLITGTNPSDCQEYIETTNAQDRPLGYDAAFAALTHAVKEGKLPANTKYSEIIRHKYSSIGLAMPENAMSEEPDWQRTTVSLSDLKIWLSVRGVKSGFFFPGKENIPEYLDVNNVFHAPKLAAAISAWQAVTNDMTQLGTKTPKQAIEIWLRKNADKFGLTKDDGNPNETGIDEIAKIANWNTKGGAPKTPG